MKSASVSAHAVNRRKFVAGAALAPLLPIGLVNCSQGASTSGWTFDLHNPVLGGSLGVCFDPYVLKDGAPYRMWFSWRTKKAIGYTESLNCYKWDPPKIVVAVDPALDTQTDVNRPSVLIRNNVFHMWYTGQSIEKSEIYRATSVDGLNWTRASSAPVLAPSSSWEKNAVMCPDVLWDEETALFRLYYSAGEQYEPDCIVLATSSDGVTWTRREQPIFTADISLK